MSSFYVYTLHWPDTVYHGYAKQLQRRLAEHRSRCRKGTEHNSVIQDYYDHNGMWYDVTYEEFYNKEDALAYERELVNAEAGEDWCLNSVRNGHN